MVIISTDNNDNNNNEHKVKLLKYGNIKKRWREKKRASMFKIRDQTEIVRERK